VRFSFSAFALVLAAAASLSVTSPGFAADPPSYAPARILAYKLTPGETLRYNLRADVKGSIPILDSPEPMDLTAVIKMTYLATPKTRLADGTMDVEFKVENVELEVAKIPFPVPEDQARDILNQIITMASSGEVLKTHEGKPLPFGVSIPGVDPKRLYALLFPIVFPTKAVKEGAVWKFKSELLGGDGANPRFTATLLKATAPSKPPKSGGKAKGKPKPADNSSAAFAAGFTGTRLQEDFQMAVNQKVTAEKKPATSDADTHRTRTGNIQGKGEFNFDREQGRMTRGVVTISANIKDDLVGKPLTDDEPKHLISKVDATVTVELEPAGAGGTASGEKAEEKKEKP
jgi:hypothetical protein